jgi:hypothetical protein
MKLKYKYVIGTHVTFYEIEMFCTTFTDGLINTISTIENKENILVDICFNISEYFEKIDTNKTSSNEIMEKFYLGIKKLKDYGIFNINIFYKTNNEEIYNIADYRRDLNNNYCKKVDFVLWGETDSFFPKEAFSVIEYTYDLAKISGINRFILSFAERKMWDESWRPTEHVDYENIPFVDSDDSHLNENYAKSLISIEKMNEINSKTKEYDIRYINYPKIDGSCLVISSDLIKSGANLPHALLCSGDDASFGTIAKLICGDKFYQFICKNILKVHARRHPQKRMYIKNENNPFGFCGDKKGEWWITLQKFSKHNLNNLLNSQENFYTFKDVFENIK